MNDARIKIDYPSIQNPIAEGVVNAFEILAELANPDMVSWAKNIARTHVEHYIKVFSCVHEILSNHEVRNVVDVGAVPGFITSTLKHEGLEVEAVDIAPDRTKGIFQNAEVPTHEVDVEHNPLPFADESQDLILFNEIIEHLRTNPIYPLREIHRVLRPGGSLLLSTPNITFPMRLRFLLGTDYNDDIIDEFKKLETIGHMGHFRLYSETELERLLKHVGFSIVEITTHSVSHARASWKRKLLTKFFPNKMKDHIYFWVKKN